MRASTTSYETEARGDRREDGVELRAEWIAEEREEEREGEARVASRWREWERERR